MWIKFVDQFKMVTEKRLLTVTNVTDVKMKVSSVDDDEIKNDRSDLTSFRRFAGEK